MRLLHAAVTLTAHASHGQMPYRESADVDRHPIDIRPIADHDMHAFDALRVAYGVEMGGAPMPDPDFARSVLNKPFVVHWGAYEGERLVGFLLGFEVPEAVTGRRPAHLTTCMSTRPQGAVCWARG